MANKPLLNRLIRSIEATNGMNSLIFPQSQAVGQDYQENEKFLHINNVRYLFGSIRAKCKLLVVKLVNIVELLRINSRADAIDELKDIYRL